MLKNYKPYGELDLTGDGYLFDLTAVEMGTILSSLPGEILAYKLTNEETDLGNDLAHSTLNLTKLKEQIECGKFNKITCQFKIEDDIYTISLNKSGSSYIITASLTGGITITFEVNVYNEYVMIRLAGANLVLE